MADSSIWVPPGVDTAVPSPARMYDYALGGGHNFAADRELSDRIIARVPTIGHIILLNRAFLRRVVLTLVDAGVRQFLDIGSGIPTAGNVHEIAQRAAPDSRVVYVDIDPVAVAHSDMTLRDNDRATAILADMRDPTSILQHPKTRRMLDFDAPIALLMITILHFAADSENPMELMARYRDPLVPGSYVAITHATTELNTTAVSGVVELFQETPTPIYPRSRTEIAELFTGFELLDPGLVTTAEWRPHRAADGEEWDPKDDIMFAGVGIKR